MSLFTGPLRLEHLDADWRNWKLLEPLIWEVDEEGSGMVVEVPAGFETDGASVPRLLWPLFPMTGSYMRAAAVHDRLCRLLTAGTPHQHAPTRLAADRQFRLACAACRVPGWQRWFLYIGVRIGALLGIGGR
jgi:hypothetical protein